MFKNPVTIRGKTIPNNAPIETPIIPIITATNIVGCAIANTIPTPIAPNIAPQNAPIARSYQRGCFDTSVEFILIQSCPNGLFALRWTHEKRQAAQLLLSRWSYQNRLPNSHPIRGSEFLVSTFPGRTFESPGNWRPNCSTEHQLEGSSFSRCIVFDLGLFLLASTGGRADRFRSRALCSVATRRRRSSLPRHRVF